MIDSFIRGVLRDWVCFVVESRFGVVASTRGQH